MTVRNTARRPVRTIGKWMGLGAVAVVGVAAAARLGRENYWFAPFILGVAALCMIIIWRIVAKSPLPSRRKR